MLVILLFFSTVILSAVLYLVILQTVIYMDLGREEEYQIPQSVFDENANMSADAVETYWQVCQDIQAMSHEQLISFSQIAMKNYFYVLAFNKKLILGEQNNEQ